MGFSLDPQSSIWFQFVRIANLAEFIDIYDLLWSHSSSNTEKI